ncbi:hypothetical protein SDC9_110345 [bioreactor metagenome]|uniref:Uncharacterized protein n=1 Tax=bioreactor metagenome TaxID=1076179 RepID=A0A645BDD7_9ZZZZ
MREHGDLGAHRRGDLDAHVAQPAHPDDGDPAALADPPVVQRGVGGDPGAQQRRGHLPRQGLGDMDRERLPDDDLLRVATLGVLAVGHRLAVREDAAVAELFLPRQAVLALPAGVDHAADTGHIAHPEPGHLGADRGDDADDLVAGRQRPLPLPPLTGDRADIGVADAAVGDVDPDVIGAQVATLHGEGLEWLAGPGRSPGTYGGGHLASCRCGQLARESPPADAASPDRRCTMPINGPPTDGPPTDGPPTDGPPTDGPPADRPPEPPRADRPPEHHGPVSARGPGSPPGSGAPRPSPGRTR